MHESDADLGQLQTLLDASHAAAGPHLRAIFDEKHRVSAVELADMLPGVQLLNLATITAHCEPRVAPVDGLFSRGRFWFGSSPASARFTHLGERPQVSASHTRGESLAVVVHGRATLVDLSDPGSAGFRDYCREVYGADWDDWGAGAAYARIDGERMYPFRFERPPDSA